MTLLTTVAVAQDNRVQATEHHAGDTINAGPIDGMGSFFKHMSQHTSIPSSVRMEMGCVKFVFSFIVNEDGTISDVDVMKGAGADVDAIMKKAVMTAPPWNPATVNGRAVKQKMFLPMYIKLG